MIRETIYETPIHYFGKDIIAIREKSRTHIMMITTETKDTNWETSDDIYNYILPGPENVYDKITTAIQKKYDRTTNVLL